MPSERLRYRSEGYTFEFTVTEPGGIVHVSREDGTKGTFDIEEYANLFPDWHTPEYDEICERWIEDNHG